MASTILLPPSDLRPSSTQWERSCQSDNRKAVVGRFTLFGWVERSDYFTTGESFSLTSLVRADHFSGAGA